MLILKNPLSSILALDFYFRQDDQLYRYYFGVAHCSRGMERMEKWVCD